MPHTQSHKFTLPILGIRAHYFIRSYWMTVDLPINLYIM